MPHEELSEAAVLAALSDFRDPETGRSVTQLGQIHALRLEGSRVAIVLGLTTWAAPFWEPTATELTEYLERRLPGVEVSVELAIHQRKPEKLGEIGLAAKTVVAVASGKGGVGKSSIAAYLALALQRAGCEVGLMDADVYGPSIPHLLGSREPPQIIGERIQPVVVDGLRVMSMGFLVSAGRGSDLARPDAAYGADAVPSRHRLGRAGLSGHRHAAGHGRRGVVAFPTAAAYRGGGRLHAPGRGPAGRGEGHRHVPQGPGARCWAWWRT